MIIQERVNLVPFNTFGLQAVSRYYTEISSPEELRMLANDKETAALPKLILGGGSNLVLMDDLDLLTLRITIPGWEIVGEAADYILLKVGAGVIWHDFVVGCVSKGWGGVENLSLIPGTVGAAPIQNIGAYGVELKDVFESLEAISLETGETRIFELSECGFGYRDSIFKRRLKGKYVITSVTFRLMKEPVLNLGYGDVKKTLEAAGRTHPTVRDVSDAVIEIRRSKLPDPAVIGNAGSFFKNPEIPVSQFEQLKLDYPDLPGYKVDDAVTKVPAGWLIEHDGWKGYRDGNIGVHSRQALVLVNYGGGNGQQIRDLAFKIRNSVKSRFGIELTPEVNFV